MEPNGGDTAPDASGTSRRAALKLLGGGAIGALSAKVGYEYTGFGVLTGTNLLEQDLAPIARRRLGPDSFRLDWPTGRIHYDDGILAFRPRDDGRERTAAVRGPDRGPVDLGDPRVDGVVRDLRAIEAGDFGVEFLERSRFVPRLHRGEPRPLTVAALRGDGYRSPIPATVREFADCEPADVPALVAGLADGFSRRTYFDAVRYLAGTVDAVLPFAGLRLRAGVDHPTDFAALLERPRGLYCYEYALRSVEAFHVRPPWRQSVPVFGGVAIDERHDHAYTVIGSVVREDGAVTVALTFLDYFYATLYDRLGVEGVVGEGINAYDDRHRATAIHYRNPYA